MEESSFNVIKAITQSEHYELINIIKWRKETQNGNPVCFSYLLRNKQLNTIISINTTAQAILELVGANKSLGEIVSFLHNKYKKTNYDKIYLSTLKFIRKVESEGLINVR